MLNDKQKTSRLDHSEEARQNRVLSLRKKTGKKLPALSIHYLNSNNLTGNIENLIGSMTLPIGVAGPLKINFKEGAAAEEVYAALATTEGALISSIARGVLALNLSGGVTSRVIENKVTRAPVFLFDHLDDALRFSKWIPSQLEKLKLKTKDHSRFAELADVQVKLVQREVHTLFSFSTGDAAGQNMSTFVSHSLTQWLRNEYLNESGLWIRQILIEGNLSSDKKVSYSSLERGRGRKVLCEIVIPSPVIKKVFKVSAEELSRNYNRMKSARIHSGYMAFNINVANVVAGVFLATGQDAASIHESSVAELHMEVVSEGLFISLYMPSLILGTIGGGTHLPHAKTIIELMGCEGRGGADRLAQTICSYALALDLSTMAAIQGGQFVQAHESLGRSSHRAFQIQDIDVDFLNQHRIDSNIEFVTIERISAISFDDAMMMDLATISARRLCGIFEIQATIRSKVSKAPEHKSFILKLKTCDDDIINSTKQMLISLGAGFITEGNLFYKFHPFLNSQSNEVSINEKLQNFRCEFTPRVYISKIVQSHGFILQEKIQAAEKKFLNWQDFELDEVIRDLSKIHNQDYKNENLTGMSSKEYSESKDLWASLSDIVKEIRFTDDELKIQKLNQMLDFCVAHYDEIFQQYDKFEKRFCHLDFNPRNILFSNISGIKIIDWEFSGISLPQRDLLEFLIFTRQGIDQNKLKSILTEYPGLIRYDKDSWDKGLRIAFFDFVLRRLNLYLLTSEFKKIHFLDSIVENTLLFYQELFNE